MTRGGWAGTILRIDLTREKIVKQPLKKDLARNFLGGRGFTSKLLWDEIEPGTDPLGIHNRIFIGVGPCNGTLIPGSTRTTIAAKSPLSGFMGDSNSGGTIGAELKYAGYDAIAIQGRAKSPSYLWIDDDDVHLRTAGYLWGKTTGETRRAILTEIGDPGACVVSIGPAGENLVKFASIISDVGRCHGRCGIGAVMGSKNLKAVVVRGTKGVKIANGSALEKAVREMYELYHGDQEWHKNITEYGTLGSVSRFDAIGVWPTRNYQTGVFRESQQLSPRAFMKLFSAGRRSCFSCPLGCQHYWVISQDPYKGTHTEGVEMMDLSHYGARVGNTNATAVIKMHELSNELGLDVADTSGVIAWALECFEKGILTIKETDGLRLEWGDHRNFVELIKMISRREGFGNLLAEGEKRASEIIGRGSKKYALHVKGLTLDARDPRAVKGWALGYAVAARGAEHCRAGFGVESFDVLYNISTEGKAEGIVWHENIRAIQNALQICEICGYSGKMFQPRILSKFYGAVTGSSINDNELLMIGERIVNIERAFNVREGLTRKDDGLPERFLKEPMPEGPAKGQVVDLQTMINKYYEIRGWDRKTGLQRKTKLLELGLKDIADELLGQRKVALS